MIDATIKTCRNTFPATVNYAPPGLPAISITGIFDAQFEVVTLVDGIPMSSQRPVLDVRLADCVGFTPAIGHSLSISGVTYEVTDVQLDGRGSAKLFMVVS